MRNQDKVDCPQIKGRPSKPTRRKNKMQQTIKMSGKDIKADNGSGYNLAGTFKGRRFHDETIYDVNFNGVRPDRSTITSIRRSRNGWGN